LLKYIAPCLPVILSQCVSKPRINPQTECTAQGSIKVTFIDEGYDVLRGDGSGCLKLEELMKLEQVGLNKLESVIRFPGIRVANNFHGVPMGYVVLGIVKPLDGGSDRVPEIRVGGSVPDSQDTFHYLRNGANVSDLPEDRGGYLVACANQDGEQATDRLLQSCVSLDGMASDRPKRIFGAFGNHPPEIKRLNDTHDSTGPAQN
jgi:hypothetical protein